MALSILLSLGMSCANGTKNVKFHYGQPLPPRPLLTPDILDDSPRECEVCPEINEQPTFLVTGRDHVATKRKIIELDDYIETLMFIMREYGVID